MNVSFLWYFYQSMCPNFGKFELKRRSYFSFHVYAGIALIAACMIIAALGMALWRARQRLLTQDNAPDTHIRKVQIKMGEIADWGTISSTPGTEDSDWDTIYSPRGTEYPDIPGYLRTGVQNIWTGLRILHPPLKYWHTPSKFSAPGSNIKPAFETSKNFTPAYEIDES